jgi:hypothetical protein
MVVRPTRMRPSGLGWPRRRPTVRRAWHSCRLSRVGFGRGCTPLDVVRIGHRADVVVVVVSTVLLLLIGCRWVRSRELRQLGALVRRRGVSPPVHRSTASSSPLLGRTVGRRLISSFMEMRPTRGCSRRCVSGVMVRLLLLMLRLCVRVRATP